MTDTIQDRLRGDIYEAMLENARDMTEEQEAQRSAAAAHIDAQDARIARLESAIKRQAGAAKTLRHLTLSEVQHLKDKDRSEYVASKTLESEREANAMLTDELEAQDAKIKALVEALSASVATIEDYIAYEHDGDPWTEDARAMREMDIDDYATDGRLDKAKGLIAAAKETT